MSTSPTINDQTNVEVTKAFSLSVCVQAYSLHKFILCSRTKGHAVESAVMNLTIFAEDWRSQKIWISHVKNHHGEYEIRTPTTSRKLSQSSFARYLTYKMKTFTLFLSFLLFADAYVQSKYKSKEFDDRVREITPLSSIYFPKCAKCNIYFNQQSQSLR